MYKENCADPTNAGRLGRDSSIDAVGGVLIIYMVITHLPPRLGVVNYAFNDILSTTLFFFMAWFYFKSGMLAKSLSPIETIHKYSKKLLVTYLLYSAIGLVVGIVLVCVGDSESISTYIRTKVLSYLYMCGSIDGNLPLWFLPSLFFVIVIGSLVREYRIRPIYTFVGALVLFECIVSIKWFVKQDDGVFPIPYFLINVPLGYVFYYLGSFFKRNCSDGVSAFCSVIIYLMALLFPLSFDFRTGNTAALYMPLQYVLCSIGGIIMFNYIFRIIPGVFIRPLSYVGRNAMLIFVSHWIFIDLAKMTQLLFHLNYFQIVFVAIVYVVGGSMLLMRCGKHLSLFKV